MQFYMQECLFPVLRFMEYAQIPEYKKGVGELLKF